MLKFLILFIPILLFSQADTVSFDQINIAPGDTVPNFSAQDEAGKVHLLSELKGKKNLVLIFYRGYW